MRGVEPTRIPSGPRARRGTQAASALGAVSHAIRLNELSTVSANVAIPTIWLRGAARCRGELHATFVESSPGGSHALPLIAPPVAQPLAQPVARRWPGTVAGHGRYRRRKQPAQAHHDRPRGHARAHDETTNFNTDFPVPTRRKVTLPATRFANPPRRHPPPPTPTFPHQQAEKSPQNQHDLPILHVDSNQLGL